MFKDMVAVLEVWWLPRATWLKVWLSHELDRQLCSFPLFTTLEGRKKKLIKPKVNRTAALAPQQPGSNGEPTLSTPGLHRTVR